MHPDVELITILTKKNKEKIEFYRKKICKTIKQIKLKTV